MKKIIATVLAMVMALALCVTAFAATADKAYDNKGKELTGTYEYELMKAQSNKKLDYGTIKHYVVNGNTYYVAADASSYDLKLVYICDECRQKMEQGAHRDSITP